jgi:hypothetical protein
LVETGVVEDETLDIRLKERITGIKSQMNEMRKEAYKNIPFSYGGPMGEA